MARQDFFPWLLLLVALAGVPGCISSETLASSFSTAPAADVLLARASQASLKKDHIAAEQALRQLVKQNKDHLAARIALADVYCDLARERGADPNYEPPAAIAQLEYAARQQPEDLALARRLMLAYREINDLYQMRFWALKVAQLDKRAPVATQIVTEALFERDNYEMGEPLLKRLSQMPAVRPLVVLNLSVELARSRDDLAAVENPLEEYLQTVSSRTHLDWGGIPSEDIPRLFTVLEAAIESSSDIRTREDRLSQAITIVKRLMQTETGQAYSDPILSRASQLILKTDQWNLGVVVPEEDRLRVSQKQYASRRRFCETATQLPDGIILEAETLNRIGRIQTHLQSG